MYGILLRFAESGKIRKVFLFFHEISMLPETKIMYEKIDRYELNKMAHLTFAKIEIRNEE